MVRVVSSAAVTQRVRSSRVAGNRDATKAEHSRLDLHGLSFSVSLEGAPLAIMTDYERVVVVLIGIVLFVVGRYHD